MVAIVGARNASAAGVRFAERLARERFWRRPGNRGNSRGGAALDRRAGEGKPDTRSADRLDVECRRFSRARKSHRRDWTAWLGW
jgi:hypothetical protein